MKAIVYESYGPPDVLHLTDVLQPEVTENDVLVRVRAASVNPADWHLMRGEPYVARLSFGLPRPKYNILGCDLAGVVEAVGSAVTSFRPGDEVYGSTFMRGFGAFAEWASAPQDVLAPKPVNVTFEQAAAVPVAALTALQGLRDHGQIAPGQHVLIIGGSGGVGSFAVQIARSYDTEVTAVTSTRNIEFVQSLGAARVIDYTREDFTQGGPRFDLILQAAGDASPGDVRRALKPGGTAVLISGDSPGRWIGAIDRAVKALVLSKFVREDLVSFTVKPNRPDLEALTTLIESGAITPAIDHTYALDQVPEAIRYLEEGHARGKVSVTMQ